MSTAIEPSSKLFPVRRWMSRDDWDTSGVSGSPLVGKDSAAGPGQESKKFYPLGGRKAWARPGEWFCENTHRRLDFCKLQVLQLQVLQYRKFQLEVTTTAFSSLPPTSETIWILVPFSNVFCPLVPHYIMPLSNLLPLGDNQTYAIRSVLYPNLCAHEANFTVNNLNPGELPCLGIYILAEIFVFKTFTVIMLSCNEFYVPDQVSLLKLYSDSFRWLSSVARSLKTDRFSFFPVVCDH